MRMFQTNDPQRPFTLEVTVKGSAKPLLFTATKPKRKAQEAAQVLVYDHEFKEFVVEKLASPFEFIAVGNDALSQTARDITPPSTTSEDGVDHIRDPVSRPQSANTMSSEQTISIKTAAKSQAKSTHTSTAAQPTKTSSMKAQPKKRMNQKDTLARMEELRKLQAKFDRPDLPIAALPPRPPRPESMTKPSAPPRPAAEHRKTNGDPQAIIRMAKSSSPAAAAAAQSKLKRTAEAAAAEDELEELFDTPASKKQRTEQARPPPPTATTTTTTATKRKVPNILVKSMRGLPKYLREGSQRDNSAQPTPASSAVVAAAQSATPTPTASPPEQPNASSSAQPPLLVGESVPQPIAVAADEDSDDEEPWLLEIGGKIVDVNKIGEAVEAKVDVEVREVEEGEVAEGGEVGVVGGATEEVHAHYIETSGDEVEESEESEEE